MNKIHEQLLKLSKYCMMFADVNRATMKLDFQPESDTDHTVMLGIIGCSLASKLVPNLDLGKIAQYAFVHDFAEVLAGDTDTSKPFDKHEKEQREKQALNTLREEFKEIPWLSTTIDEYESLASPEARFVKFLDKVLPKITHLLTDCRAVHNKKMTANDLKKFMDHQIDMIMNSYGYDQYVVKEFADSMSNELYNLIVSSTSNVR